MLKKHNKLVMMILLVAFMFSIVGSAGAATFSDVSGNDAEASAIYKLNSLGIIDGYPDGTFGAEKTITRAEFAKIACVTAGLEAVASGMTDVPSSFSDVSADFWGNGWINVAAAQGFVKGYPDGTFGPNAQISQAEVTTVLLRILGYNDNLTGNWPSDYIAKAANLGVLDDVTFVANKAATRGEVAILGGATLDEEVVDYIASDNIFEAKAADLTLLADKFDDSNKIKDALVTELELGDDSALEITYWAKDEHDVIKKKSDTVSLADDYVVSGADSILNVANRMVDYIVNDDDEIVYIAVKDYDVISTDTVEVTRAGNIASDADGSYYTVSGIEKVKVEDKTYDMAANFAVYTDDVKTAAAAKLYVNEDKEYKDKDFIDVVLNDDGDVALIRAYHYYVPAIVDDVTNTKNTVKVSFKDPGTGFDSISGKNLKDEDIFVEKNGVAAELSDLEENDLAVVYADYRGLDYYIQAFDNRVEGELTAVKASGDYIDKVTVAGTEYKASEYIGAPIPTAGPYLFVDGGEDVDQDCLKADEITGDGEYDLFGTDVTLLLTPANRVAAIISDTEGEENSGRIYATVIKGHDDKYSNGELRDLLKVFCLNSGKEVTYSIDDDATYRDTEDGKYTHVDGDGKTVDNKLVHDTCAQNDFVYFNLTKDGEINHLTKLKYGVNEGSYATTKPAEGQVSLGVDEDLDSIKIGTAWYDASDAVIANIKKDSDSEDSEIVKWSDVEDYIKNATSDAPASIAYYVDNNELKYAVVNAKDLSSDSEIAIAKNHGKDSTDSYVTLVEGDEYVKYYVSDSTSADNERPSSGAVLSIKWDAGDVNIVKVFAPTEKTVDGDALAAVITDINNNSVVAKVYSSSKVVEVSYLVDEDTKYFDNTDTDAPYEITKSDLSKGSEAWIILDGGDVDEAVTGIILVDENYTELSK